MAKEFKENPENFDEGMTQVLSEEKEFKTLSEKIDEWAKKHRIETCGALQGGATLFPKDVEELKEDIKEFIKRLKAKATKQIRLNFDKKPCKEEDEFVNCGGCGRFVLEEGCTCGMIKIKEVDNLAGDKLI